MGHIQVLDFAVANLIAAGEVVDRPSSAVKELVENAIDAGSTGITVEVKRGGIAFLRVTDNGCGMSREDAQNCIKRHATSKIREASDLDSILTLGFRGEALAAIAAVSKLRIMTRCRGDEVGTLVSCENGEEVTVTDAGCAEGTTIIAEELFSNVPARRKVLKTDATETASVSAVVEKMALSHPEISFKLITDGNLRFSTPGDNKLINAVHAVFGRDFAKNLIRVGGMTNGIEIYGYIGSPSNIRKNRNFENFFINGRYVKSRTVAAALEQAFDSYIPEDKFPVCVLNVRIHPALVDVNVHPAKLEVKFSNERLIFDSVYSAVRSTLMESIRRPVIELDEALKSEMEAVKIDSPFVPLPDRTVQKPKAESPYAPLYERPASAPPQSKPSVPIERAEPNPMPQAESIKAEEPIQTVEAIAATEPMPIIPPSDDEPMPVSSISAPSVPNEKPVVTPPLPQKPDAQTVKREEINPITIATAPSAEEKAEPAIPERLDERENAPVFKIVGDVFYSYVVVETPDRMLMVDKHAAHERILFEEMKKRMDGQKVSSQILMMPLRTHLSAEELAASVQYREEFLKFGFDYEPVQNESAVKLIQIPSDLAVSEAPMTFQQMCADLIAGRDASVSRQIAFEKAIYQTACKAAVKAGRVHSDEDLQYIVDKLLRLDNIKYCPHGRPVAFEITKQWLDNRFKRS